MNKGEDGTSSITTNFVLVLINWTENVNVLSQ